MAHTAHTDRSLVPAWVEPMLAKPDGGTLRSGPAWAYEYKLDGYRAAMRIAADGTTVLTSRNGIDFTAEFPQLAGVLGDGLGLVRADAEVDDETVVPHVRPVVGDAPPIRSQTASQMVRSARLSGVAAARSAGDGNQQRRAGRINPGAARCGVGGRPGRGDLGRSRTALGAARTVGHAAPVRRSRRAGARVGASRAPMVQWWHDLAAPPELTPELVAKLVDGVAAEFGGREADIATARDRALRALLALKDATGLDERARIHPRWTSTPSRIRRCPARRSRSAALRTTTC
jgi:hypothetical protein